MQVMERATFVSGGVKSVLFLAVAGVVFSTLPSPASALPSLSSTDSPFSFAEKAGMTCNDLVDGAFNGTGGFTSLLCIPQVGLCFPGICDNKVLSFSAQRINSTYAVFNVVSNLSNCQALPLGAEAALAGAGMKVRIQDDPVTHKISGICNGTNNLIPLSVSASNGLDPIWGAYSIVSAESSSKRPGLSTLYGGMLECSCTSLQSCLNMDTGKCILAAACLVETNVGALCSTYDRTFRVYNWDGSGSKSNYYYRNKRN